MDWVLGPPVPPSKTDIALIVFEIAPKMIDKSKSVKCFSEGVLREEVRWRKGMFEIDRHKQRSHLPRKLATHVTIDPRTNEWEA